MTTSNPETLLPLADVVTAYLGAALFTATDAKGTPLDKAVTVSAMSPKARADATEACEDFIISNAALLVGLNAEQVGVNFWFTRNRHGAGFWDLGLGARGEELTAMAHPYGSSDVYLGDDGLVYLS